MYKAFKIILAFFLICSFSTEAYSAVAECSYEIRVKSNKEGINSVKIQNGSIRAKGRDKSGFDRDIQWARINASGAARTCLDDAIQQSGNGIPNSCKAKAKFESKDDQFVSQYNIEKNLKKVALNKACSAAEQLEIKKKKIEGIEIYAFNKSGYSDCRITDKKLNDYYIIAKGLATECKDGLSFREVPTGKNKWTGWYIESATQINQRIKSWCMKTYRKKKYNIDHFEIKKDTGKVRAKFDCL